MLLGGLWHGAAWNFFFWGAFHGVLLAAERRFGTRWNAFLPRPLRMAATFLLVNLSWVLFRARDLPAAVDYYRAMFGLGGLGEERAAGALLSGILYQPYSLLCFAVAALVTWTAPQAWDWTRRLTVPRLAACAACLVLALVAMETQGYNPFIYFIF
jgi:alginate O-acetyltransferase complex protein AlgI